MPTEVLFVYIYILYSYFCNISLQDGGDNYRSNHFCQTVTWSNSEVTTAVKVPEMSQKINGRWRRFKVNWRQGKKKNEWVTFTVLVVMGTCRCESFGNGFGISKSAEERWGKGTLGREHLGLPLCSPLSRWWEGSLIPYILHDSYSASFLNPFAFCYHKHRHFL